MQLQTFQGFTMAEALSQVKTALGSEAVILHTRTVQRKRWLGLRSQECFEITAGRDVNVRARGPVEPVRREVPREPARPASSSSPAARAYGANRPALTPNPPAPTPAGPKSILETPAANFAAINGLTSEMNSLKTMVKDLVSQVRHQKSPQVPEELFDHYLKLVENLVADEVAIDVVRSLQKTLRPELLSQPDRVREALAEQLEKMIPFAGPVARTKTVGPHVIALIGPTGVGKTTTLAKLAANLKLRERHKVALITIDTYRIAAIDQLKRYADIIGAPLKIVGSPAEIRDALNELQSFDYVLIDTAGRSPSDTLKLNELKQFIDIAEPDEVHLVLSTTSSQQCVELALERFNDVRVDKLIFTKLDEAAQLGVVLNVARKVNKGLAYITTGQDVPDDIEVGHGKRLAALILGDKLK